MPSTMKTVLALVLPVLLVGCGPDRPAAHWTAAPSPSASPSPSPMVSTAPAPTPAKSTVTPAACRYATQREVSDIVGQPVYGWTEATGGCWYRLSQLAGVLTSVQIIVFRNRVAEKDKGEVSLSGLGGTAYWDERSGNLEIQLGRDVLWVNTGDIDASDKLAPAKALLALVRKRL